VKRHYWILTAAVLVAVGACDSNVSPMENGSAASGAGALEIPPGFDFATTRAVEISVAVTDYAGGPIPGVRFDIYRADADLNVRLLSGATGPDGRLAVLASLPTFSAEIEVRTAYLGLVSSQRKEISGSRVHFDFGGLSPPATASASPGTRPSTAGKAAEYSYLGGWNSQGVPDYLEPQRDAIDRTLLDVVNASLPEQYPVPDYHPDYLASGSATDVVLTDSADIWVTFVHEGAGWTNSLGFFAYDADSTPSSVVDVASHTIIFPNVSSSGSGGGLRAGDKVHLGRFGPGTGIGWFIVAQGWTGSGVGGGVYTHYSNPTLNLESDPLLRQHNVLLYDQDRDILLLGFEDVRRDIPSCDQDFNDAIFYVTANPIEAVVVENIAPTDNGIDDDGDGISNVFDDYPTDPTRAFSYVYPAENSFGSLAFEDLWPGLGDYDMNDLVVDYNFSVIANAANDAVQIDGTFAFRAIGASYQNGFGFEMPVPASAVSTVSGSSLTTGTITLRPNGTESGHTRAVVIVADNASNVLQPGHFVNTDPAGIQANPDTVRISIQLANAVDMSTLGLAPYNPFLIKNGMRGFEVHLPDASPTSLADTQILGTGADATGRSGRTYVTSQGLPWVIHVPVSFAYPVEKQDITFAHLRFGQWAESGGFSYSDWYLDLTGYRTRQNIFTAR